MDLKINVIPDAEISVEELMTMFHPDNSQDRDEEEMMAIRLSIRENGLSGESIIVNKWNTKILGGHGKTEACWLEGYRGRLPVVYENHPSEIAHRKRMLQLNLARGHQDKDKEVKEVMALVEKYGQHQVANELAFTPEEIANLIANAEKPPVNILNGDSGMGGEGGGSGNASGEEVTCPKCGHEFSV